jgi:predicted ferric reductase
MSRIKTLQDLFKRYRRPGDFVIALLSLLFALFLAVNLPAQTTWVARTKLFAQPAFWPSIAVGLMVVFSALHLIGALVSERIEGRMQEVLAWFKAFEFVAWFMVYVMFVPITGYLPTTILFALLMTYRLGYRGWRWSLAATAVAVVIVVLFKGMLQVKIPSGAIYEYLPAGTFRSFVMLNF